MSKKPYDRSGPGRDQRRGATIIDAKPVETKTVDAATSPAAPADAPPVGEPVAASTLPTSPADVTPDTTSSPAAEAGPLGAPAASDTPSSAPADDARADRDPIRAATGPSIPETPTARSVPPTGSRPSEAAPAAAPVRPAEPARGHGFGSLLAASVLGGLVGAGLMAAYDGLSGDPAADLAPRLAQVEQRVAARPPLEPLEQRLAQVETAQKAAQGALDGTRQAAERAAATAQQALDRPFPATTPASEANAKAIQDLTGRVAALDGAVKSANEAARASGEAARASGEAAKALEGRLAEQDKTLQAAVQRATEQATRAGQAMQRVAAAERISDALRSGAPYAEALDVLRRSGADAGRLQAVAPFAASGAPTAAALAGEFRPVAERIAAAASTPPAARGQASAEGGDWTGSLLKLADRLVTVRPSGEAAPDAVKAALDRVETALRGGDLRGALAAYDALPEGAKGASQDFGRRLRDRVAAEDAARTLAGEAFAGLNTPAR